MNNQYIYEHMTLNSEGDDGKEKILDEQRKLFGILSDCIRIKQGLLRKRAVCFVLSVILTIFFVVFVVMFHRINVTLFFSVIIVFAAFYASVISFTVSVNKRLYRNCVKIESIEKRIVEIG